MIDEVLHVARLEQGVAQRSVEWGPVTLADTVRGVAQVLRQEAMVKGITLTTRIAPDLPPLAGDERLLQSLVFHLVENAVKFTPSGGRVAVSLDEDAGSLRLSVEDDGIGVPREYHERIFEKFFMVDSSLAKAHGGAGIGLYLARGVATIHDGRIDVESAPGRGTRFQVHLPLRPPA
jgi:signal transduction histidine kinase